MNACSLPSSPLPLMYVMLHPSHTHTYTLTHRLTRNLCRQRDSRESCSTAPEACVCVCVCVLRRSQPPSSSSSPPSFEVEMYTLTRQDMYSFRTWIMEHSQGPMHYLRELGLRGVGWRWWVRGNPFLGTARRRVSDSGPSAKFLGRQLRLLLKTPIYCLPSLVEYSVLISCLKTRKRLWTYNQIIQ